MNEEQWIQMAINYFNGKMTSEEEELFLKETGASKPLSDLMELWKDTDIQAAAYEHHRAAADEFIRTHNRLKPAFIGSPRSKQPAPTIWRWVTVAAVVAGVFFFTRALLPPEKNKSSAQTETITPNSTDRTATLQSKDSVHPQNNHAVKQLPSPGDSTDPELLYAAAFTPDELPADQNGPLEDAYFYYASRQYRKAIAAIDSIHTKELTRGAGNYAQLNFYAAYYKALCMLSLGNATGAIPVLIKAAAIAQSPQFVAKAEWYLSLAYLKTGNKQSAIKHLELVRKNRSAVSYRTKAENLLRALNK